MSFDVLAAACAKLTDLTKDKVKEATKDTQGNGVTGDCTVTMALGTVSARAKWAERGNTPWKDYATELQALLDKANTKLKEAGKQPVKYPQPEITKSPYAVIEFTSQALRGKVGESLGSALLTVTAALIQEGLKDNDLAKLGLGAEVVAKARKMTPMEVKPA